MKKNDIVTAVCVDYTQDGSGIVKVDGFPLFVKNLIVGETADIIVTKIQKHYGYGKWLRLHAASSYRAKPRCPLFPACGGCQLQHMTSEHQQQFKHNLVKQTLSRIGKITTEVKPPLMMDDPWQYRNKVQVPVGVQNDGQIQMGFYRTHSHTIIPFEHCYLQGDRANELVQWIRKEAQRLQVGDLLRHVLIKDMRNTNQMMLVFVVRRGGDQRISSLSKAVCEVFAEVVSVIENVNHEDTNVILGKQQRVLYGSETVEAQLDGLRFQIACQSFFQVNPSQTERLYRKVVELADIHPHEQAVDVYCGVGGITMFLARKAKQVIGIEIVPDAIENAKENVRRNHLSNVTFLCGDAKTCTAELVKQGFEADVAVVDPPRKGCDEQTLEALVMMNPKRLVYVSCHPGTLARDLHWLSEHGYEVKEVQPVDMFPQTCHVETVCLLSNRR